MTKGPLALDQALKCAIEIAGALDKAHHQGVTHRDLKPGNIMMTKSGAKLLDFGLAKLKQASGPVQPISTLPTAVGSADLTGQGTILGTLQYMSPEQLEGIEADARSDIFSFGAVLYEMLTGRKAFEGRSQSSLIAAIMHIDPPGISVLQPMAPIALDRIVKVCLSKDPDQRWQTAHDLALQLEWVSEGGSQVGVAAPAAVPRRKRERLAWIVAAIALAAAGVSVVLLLRHQTVPEASAIRFTIPEPPNAPYPSNGVDPFQTISPDGRHIVFRAQKNGEGSVTLWERSLDGLDSKQLGGTEDGTYPFWSPDNRFVAFFAGGKLKKIDALGGPPQIVTDAPNGEGGTWSRDGTILFGTITAGLMRVPSIGGAATQITTPNGADEISHRWPEFLPDGRHFIYITGPNWSAYLGSLDFQERKLLLRADSKVLFAPPRHLLFARGTTLTAQAFDPHSFELIGEPFPIAENLRVNTTQGRAAFSVSTDGKLTYRTGIAAFDLGWFDRSGKRIGNVSDRRDYQDLSLSPDGRQLAVHWHDTIIGGDVWLLDLLRTNLTRLTFDAAKHYNTPLWSPDGNSVIYQAGWASSGGQTIYRKAANGAGAEEILIQQGPDSAGNIGPNGVSSDGRFLIYEDGRAKTGIDLFVLTLTGDRKPSVYLQTPFDESQAQISPDGRWLAYQSNESGRIEIYIRPFPNASGGKWQVSTGGGNHVRWRGDGKELFFVTLDRKMMAVDIRNNRDALEIGVPRVLFESQFRNQVGGSTGWVVSADGQRFLLPSPPDTERGAPSDPITVVLNWAAAFANK